MASPDLLDAYVWLWTDLLIDHNAAPIVKGGSSYEGLAQQDIPLGYG